MRYSSSFSRVALIFLATVLIANLAFAAGEFWEKKEFSQWNQKDCQKLMEDSPWAKTLTLGGMGTPAGDSTDSQPSRTKYIVKFLSAEPIKEAWLRLQQIGRGYEKFSPDQKKEFEEKIVDAFLRQIPEDKIVIEIDYSINTVSGDKEAARFWQTQTTTLLKNSVFIRGTKGAKTPIEAFGAGTGAARNIRFIFPRTTADGKPVINPDDKSIALEFAYPAVSQMGDGKGFMEFKLEKMKFKDQLAF
jgi:hypothetical protein